MAAERKTAMLAQFARVAKALASPVRMELTDLLAQAERSVEDLARAAGLPVGNTSAQLRILHAAGLLASRRDGTRVYYRLAGDDVAALYRAVRDTAHARLPDARAASTAYLGSDAPAEPVTRGERLRRARAGEVLVLEAASPRNTPRAHPGGGPPRRPPRPARHPARRHRDRRLPPRRLLRPGPRRRPCPERPRPACAPRRRHARMAAGRHARRGRLT